MRKKVIYGAGDYGTRLYNFMSEKGIDIDMFCQTWVNENRTHLGLPIISLRELLNLSYEVDIYIAIFNKSTSAEIKEVLLDNGIDNVYECGEFVQRNLLEEQGIKPIFYRANATLYDERLSHAYWKELAKEPQKLQSDLDKLKQGFCEEDVNQIDDIVTRMLSVPYPEEINDIFNNYEKSQIRLMEKRFRPTIAEELVWGKIKVWNGWKCPIEYGMDPSVWYYECGIGKIKDKSRFKDKVIIDAGAYFGDSAVVLSQYTDKYVYAIEALEENSVTINKICRMNNVKNVIPITVALGAQNGEQTVYKTQNTVGAGLLKRQGVTYVDSEKVPVITLDEYVEINNLQVGLIKADIEGGEPDMIRGAERTIREQAPTMLISVYHTANDFIEIKGMIEKINPNYRFKIFQPYSRNRLIRDTLLVCEVD